MKIEGFVKSFNPERGYGFISGQDGVQYFVHHTNIVMDGYRELRKGQHVEFETVKSPKGPQAVSLRVISAESAAA